MRKYIYIGAFGFLGAISRFALKNIDLSMLFQHFPINTLLINLTGSFVFALIFTIAYETGRIEHDLRLGITAGFLGAYTTFSTFCKDTVTTISNRFNTAAIVYIILSIILGIALTSGGIIVAKKYVMKLIRKLRSYLATNVTFMGDN